MGPKTILSAAVALASLVCMATAGPMSPNSGKWQAPLEAAAKPNPVTQKTAALAVGRKLFIRTCARCHEEDGSGQNGGAANLSCPEVQGQSDGALFWKITNGNTSNGMPSFTALSEDVRWDIVIFLRTLKEPNCHNPGSSTADKDRKDDKDKDKKEARPNTDANNPR